MDNRNTPFWDSSLSLEKRLDWLLKEMTIEEKLTCLASGMKPIERLGIPAMSLCGEAAHGVEARNDQNELKEPEPTTSFIQPIGMSATWDPELIRQAGAVTGREARVVYHLPAILWSATGAQDMGEAMAETLVGQSNPAGRLNMTWYQGDHQLPDIEDYDIIQGGRAYRYFQGEVLYPFGYGLSFTRFAYSDFSAETVDGGNIRVSFLVKNTGERPGDEVAQVYGEAPASRVKKPLRQLLGFVRLKGMAPGESRRVELTVQREEFRFYDVIGRRLMVEEGRYRIWVGPSSAGEAASAWVQLPGERTGKRDTAQKTAADHYDGYENIVLTEGHFGFTGAAVKEPSEKGVLRYGDCLVDQEASEIVLHVKSERACGITVFLDGCRGAHWEGDTATYERMAMPPLDEKARREAQERRAGWKPVYTDVRLPLDRAALEGKAGKAVEIRIELTGDVRLCCFWTDRQRPGM